MCLHAERTDCAELNVMNSIENRPSMKKGVLSLNCSDDWENSGEAPQIETR